MSKQYLTSSWGQIVVGSAMLGVVALVGIVKLANTIGLGKALGCAALGVFMAAWLIISVVLVVRGFNKM